MDFRHGGFKHGGFKRLSIEIGSDVNTSRLRLSMRPVE
jgi:hypothetical protein